MKNEQDGLIERELCRLEVDAILSAGIFDPDSNLGRLFRYVCNKYFEGAEDQLKEFNVAMDVFGRPTTFDRRRDSIVRVEASRLRKRLEEYYSNQGREHAVRIVMPAGGYSPQFVVNEAPSAPLQEARPGRRALLRWGLPAAGGLVLAFPLALIWMRKRSEPAQPVAAPAGNVVRPPGGEPPVEELRMMAGNEKARFVDRQGRLWVADKYYEGGPAVLTPQPRFIARGPDITLFRGMRFTGALRYHIPLKPGVYELRLYFAEQFYGPGLPEGGGENSRIMNISVNGQVLLRRFDVYADAGGSNIADVRVFRDVSPGSDGMVHLELAGSTVSPAFLNALEIVPGARGKMLPIRMVAQEAPVTDHAGRLWNADEYVVAGRLASHGAPVTGTAEPDLFAGERYGHFNYAIPVTPGRYTLKLYFAETWHKQAGLRSFHVLCNGTALARDFDIAREAGGAQRALVKAFRGLEPNPQGKLAIEFVPVRDYACVSALEVLDEQ